MISRVKLFSKFRKYGYIIRHCSTATKNYVDSTQQTDSVSAQEVTKEIFIDARQKLDSIKNPPKVKITGKEIEDKILFNSVVDSFVDKSRYLKRVIKNQKLDHCAKKIERAELLSKPVDSIIVSYLTSGTLKSKDDELIEEVVGNEKPGSKFPFAAFTPINKKFQKFHEKSEVLKSIIDDEVEYGTQDPSIPSSKIPCGGCGALLHCQNSSIPGYIPKEIFSVCTNHELRGQICQRCRILREHDIALSVQITPEDYKQVISVIKDKTAAVILIVDLMDFPCSIWPGLLDIIGSQRPVYVVGNKVDLLPQDSRGYLEGVKKSLLASLESTGLKRANIKDICLVSATTGYGVEQLITKLQSTWGSKGDVYLMGCANVGKSTLFNSLIQSDFCKTQASDILERATVSLWPGTTLNLLKFPLLRPSTIRLTARVKRLVAERRTRHAEEELRKEKLRETKQSKYATLMGHIGRTFTVKKDVMEHNDPFSVTAEKVPGEIAAFFNPNNKAFKESKWCFDTPGTINNDQILTLLTLEELILAIPNKLVKPRTVLLPPGTTYFLAGLARIDYFEGPHPILLTTFASARLPITLIANENADQLYAELLGSPLMVVPSDNQDRLKQWPGLQGRTVTFQGVDWNRSAVDVVLSSAGWVALTGGENIEYQLTVSTPEARGIHVRNPPVLPSAVNLKGSRFQGSLSYSSTRLFIQ